MKKTNFYSIELYRSMSGDLKAQNELLKTRIKMNQRLIDSYQEEIDALTKLLQEDRNE